MKVTRITHLAVVAAVPIGVAAIPISNHGTTTTPSVADTTSVLLVIHDGPKVTLTEVNTRVEWEPLPELKEVSQPLWDSDDEQEDDSGTERYCKFPGQGCQRDNISDELVINPLTHSDSQAWRFCPHPGQGCYKAKRSEEPEVESESETDALLEPEIENDAKLEMEPEADEESFSLGSSTQPEVEPEDDTGPLTVKRFCRRPGQGCLKAKRFGDRMSIPEAEIS